MARTRIAVLLCLVLVVAAASTVEAGRGRNPNPNVVIDLTEVIYDNGVPIGLIIRGDRFRSNPGRVLLDGAELNILSWNNKTIEAELPVWVVPATYRVTVTKGAASIDNFSMDVAIGASGPEGPEGPPGPMGPQGPPGTPAFYIRGTTVTLSAPDVSILARVMCDPGDVVVGGGLAYNQVGQPQMVIAQVNQPAGPGDGWDGAIHADQAGPGFDTGTSIRVTAICADITP